MKTKRKRVRKVRFDAPTFHQILDSVEDLIFVKDCDSRLLWANKAFLSYYNMSNAQIEGLLDAPFVPPDQTLQYMKDDAWVIEHGRALEIPVEPLIRHDGAIRSVQTVKYPIFDKQNKVVMTMGICRDITEQLQKEHAIELERARSISAAKMASLGEMAGGIAHEINTPLAVIHTMAGQLAEMLQEPSIDLASCVEQSGKIEQTALRIARIISGMRTLTYGNEQDGLSTVRISDLVDETLSICSERLASRGILVQVTHESTKHTVECRPSQIAQVLLNLLNNAADALEGMTTPWVRIESKRVDNSMEIAVTDSGPGLSMKTAKQIFQPFFTTKQVGKGTGLGLSISKSLIEAHHGTLTLDTDCSNTRFVVRIPTERV